ncbi:MAG: purine-binding chemotaxis protein CheW [Candidatus Rokubacteria bacterium]|nr:purine-binding chemotaxis protein CheW [Candidatus Rokubacteria bacterium]
MTQARGGVDWAAVRARVEHLRTALESVASPTPEAERRILEARARSFARPREEAWPATETVDLVVFSLGGERYAVETAHVLEVAPVRDLTPVPWAPSFVRGVVNQRGRILPVLDLRRLFGLEGQEPAEAARVVAVHAGDMLFGFLADSVGGVVRVRAAEVAPPPPTPAGSRQSFVWGVTAEMTAVLNLEALARDPRIAAGEDVR